MNLCWSCLSRRNHLRTLIWSASHFVIWGILSRLVNILWFTSWAHPPCVCVCVCVRAPPADSWQQQSCVLPKPGKSMTFSELWTSLGTNRTGNSLPCQCNLFRLSGSSLLYRLLILCHRERSNHWKDDVCLCVCVCVCVFCCLCLPLAPLQRKCQKVPLVFSPSTSSRPPSISQTVIAPSLSAQVFLAAFDFCFSFVRDWPRHRESPRGFAVSSLPSPRPSIRPSVRHGPIAASTPQTGSPLWEEAVKRKPFKQDGRSGMCRQTDRQTGRQTDRRETGSC